MEIPIPVYSDNDEIMCRAWSLRRTVLFCSFFDLVMSISFGSIYYSLGFVGLLPLFGVLGAYKYKSWMVFLYGLYNAIAIILRATIFIYYEKNPDNADNIGGNEELGIALCSFTPLKI